uniref:Ribosomal RNA processing 7 homolog A n=1 Tax=Phasianus colchicus TaxID=9054 RepID=A0A669QKW6_PHACC
GFRLHLKRDGGAIASGQAAAAAAISSAADYSSRQHPGPPLPPALRWRPPSSVLRRPRRRDTRVRSGGEGGDKRRGGGVFNQLVARSAGGEVRCAAALAALPLGEGAPGAGRARRHAPAAAHPVRHQRAPVLQPGERGGGAARSSTGSPRGGDWCAGKARRGIIPVVLCRSSSPCVKDALSRLFARCGAVQSVDLRDKPGPGEKAEKRTSKFFTNRTATGFRVAYVVFKKPDGVQAAKALSQEGPLLISTESHPVKTGISKWIARYADSVVDREELKAEVDAYMQDYDKKIAEEEAKAAKEEGLPDEEGWVKVTRKGRKPGLPRTEAANLRVLEREKRKKARKELLNFYAWQHRETKREHIAQLRKKFEEDKQRIALMRAQRKFRPY